MVSALFVWKKPMTNISSSVFENIVDESLKVLHEDFAHFRKKCIDREDVILRIREEIRSKDVDFMKIVALALTAEVIEEDLNV
jgi:hypothetical protein